MMFKKEKIVKHAWLFDVDGVITHPEKKQITEPQILDEIIRRLQKGEPVALVTGRSLDWLIDKVVDQLEHKVEDKEILDNFFVSGEFGGAHITYHNGVRKLFINSEISVPQEVASKAREITEKEFSDSMFWDKGKKTMVSIEMHDGYSVKKFKARQVELAEKLQSLLEENSLTDQFEVHQDRIATNIRNKHLNKHFAAKLVADWLRKGKIAPQVFIVFGDNESDKEMADEIHSNGMNVRFVFIGGKEQLKGLTFPFPVTFTKASLEKGTLEYLTSH